MKNLLSLMPRFAIMAITIGAFCFAGAIQSAEESPTPADSPKTTENEAATKSDAAESKKADATENKKAEATETKKAATESAKSKGGKAASSLSTKDKNFMRTAAKGGMKEVHMSQMAEQSGQSNDVKKIGKRIAADHTKANKELMALAERKGVKLDTSHKMDKMDAVNFDKEYLAMMVKDHQKTIAAFEAEAKDGTDAEVKSWAAKTLPTLRKHLAMVQKAQVKLK